MENETRSLEGGVVVKRYNIITTDLWCYRAYEPSSIMGAHSTITTIDGKWYGEIGSRRLPGWMDAMPSGDERSRVVGEYIEANYEQEYALIVRAFPEAANGRRSMGEISIYANDLAVVGL